MRRVIETTTKKEEDVTFYSSYFVVTTLTVVTLVPGPARTRYNERRRNKEMEIHPASIQGTLHPRFQKSGKTNNFGISRSSRIGGVGGQAHAKSRRTSTHGCQNRDVLGDRRGHSTRHRNSAVIPRRHIILVIQNRTTPKSKQDTPVSQFHYSSLKQEPAPRMHVNLPKINIKSFEGDPLQWLTFWDSFSAAIDKNHGLSDIEKINYLNGMLKGEAAHAISGLPLTEEIIRKQLSYYRSASANHKF